MHTIWLVRCSFSAKDEALSVSRTLLEEKLIACANISDPATALYHWENMLQQESETITLFKTTEAKITQVMSRIKMLHSYQIPSITAWKSDATEPMFADWVSTEIA